MATVPPMRELHGAVSFAAAAAAALVLGSCAAAPGKDHGPLTTQVYNVRDILWGTTPAATLHGNPADLALRVREATGASYWTTAGPSICAEDSGYLSVTADPAMQSKVSHLLDDMRTYASPPR